ncbi:complex 1 LYR family protein [Nitzschia inconspicua]|uniref:Complex 1 LYR family protein n=1 Tax=Nitzschia inconspicua TaxID=303405 RepID=A0A9K3L736_9STRA|nr:complex 1 LYR family protein [Nitzschia inconspicua]
MNRTSLELYRDCLRLVRHIAPGDSPKAIALRQTVRQQFQQNQNETNESQIEVLKANAIRALSNYMLFQSAQKDGHLKKAMTDQVSHVKRRDRSSNNDDGKGPKRDD